MNLSLEIFDVCIIGSGPAGTSAAIYSGSAGMKTILIGGLKTLDHLHEPGGLVIKKSNNINNFLGLPNISGKEFAQKILNHASYFSTIIYHNAIKIVKIEFIFLVFLDNGDKIQTKSVIICSGNGSYNKKLNIKGEEFASYTNKIFYDSVAVVGGGNSALEKVIELSNIASKIFLIHRREEFTAFQPLQDQVYSLPNVTLILNQNLNAIEKFNEILILTLRNTKKLKVNSIFILIGQESNSSIFSGEKNRENHILVNDSMETSINGIFAAGSIIAYKNKKKYTNLMTSAAEGAIAALNTHKYIIKL